jgi:hypothetical protein
VREEDDGTGLAADEHSLVQALLADDADLVAHFVAGVSTKDDDHARAAASSVRRR